MNDEKPIAKNNEVSTESNGVACSMCKRNGVLCLINRGKRAVEFFPRDKWVCFRCVVQQALVSLSKEIDL